MRWGSAGILVGLVLAFAPAAGAETVTVGFDDLAPDTPVTTQYAASHGVTFGGPGDGLTARAKAVAAGVATS